MQFSSDGKDFICGGQIFKPDTDGNVDVPDELLKKDGREDILKSKKKDKKDAE